MCNPPAAHRVSHRTLTPSPIVASEWNNCYHVGKSRLMPRKPLSALAVLVLSSLAETSRHGYNLKKDVRARSGGDVAPGATSLYRILWQLDTDGFIAETDDRPAPHHD